MSVAKTEIIKQAECARRLGVSAAAVNKLVKQQVLPVTPKGDVDWLLALAAIREKMPLKSKMRKAVAELDAAQRRIAGTTQSNDVGGGSVDDSLPISPDDYYIARADKEQSLAAMAALELRQKEGELVQLEVARAEFAKATLTVREAMLNLPDLLSPLLTPMTDQREIRALLDKQVREALGVFSDYQNEGVAHGCDCI